MRIGATLKSISAMSISAAKLYCRTNKKPSRLLKTHLQSDASCVQKACSEFEPSVENAPSKHGGRICIDTMRQSQHRDGRRYNVYLLPSRFILVLFSFDYLHLSKQRGHRIVSEQAKTCSKRIFEKRVYISGIFSQRVKTAQRLKREEAFRLSGARLAPSLAASPWMRAARSPHPTH